ncbi:hypothetical protein HYDPIDRAFT_106991 [Hydnomerulius pinastri MD-312]|nr:hypothetical protein HYDPIDRAFT_106991 [Hydnomerulius pinastri MD-312]
MFSRALSRRVSKRSLACTERKLLVSTAARTASARPRHEKYRTIQLAPWPQILVCRRALSTPAPQVNISDLPMERYHALSDATMTTLLDSLEDLLDEMGSDEYEVDYHSGVLTLSLGSNGTYVINKQPPNKQIWLSSPVSGPKRYDYVPTTDDWRYSRDGEGIGELMERELSRALGREVKLGLERVSETVE